ncbi:hypothetical protein ABZZ04_04290, partial [Streptomyces sp. NPDC006435]|uniref:hypothetical protein n=1 Tax=Streptomyces sp. NPDC006435 TaxID=3154300 RepID=UPI0033B26F52
MHRRRSATPHIAPHGDDGRAHGHADKRTGGHADTRTGARGSPRLRAGNERAREIAGATLDEVRGAM